MKFPPPTYSAAIAFVPGGNEAVLALMLPLTSALVANGVPFAEKTTSPVGRSAAGGTPFTVAVNVRVDPCCDGFCDEASEQEVVSAVITPLLLVARDRM